MKITLNRESLLKRLVSVHAILSSNPQPPITGSSLVWISEDGRMFIKTTNTQTIVEVFLPVVSCEGEKAPFICDTRTIQRVIQTLNVDEIYIEVQDKVISFGANKGRRKSYEIPLEYDANSFPKAQESKANIEFKLNGTMFCDVISKVAKFVPLKDTVHAEGFLFEQDEKGFVHVMGIRNQFFAIAKFKVNETIDKKIIIPLEIASVIDCFKQSAEIDATLSEDGRYLSFSDGSTKISTVNLNAKYVNPMQVINSFNHTSSITVNRVNLSGAIIRTASMLRNELLQTVILDVIGVDLNVETNDTAYSSKGSESIEIATNKDCDIRIGFNNKFISMMFGCFSGEMTTLFFSNEKSLTKITDNDDRGYELMFLVSPILNA